MKRKKSIILGTSLFALVIALVTYNYVFNSSHRDVVNEKASVSLSANELHFQFLNDESLATTNYLDKVIETNGKITSIENDGIILNEKLHVMFHSEDHPEIILGSIITIKGRCVGYDELLEMVKLDQAAVTNN
jgi:hypothetical protein